MFPIKLLKGGEQILKAYCKNRNHLFEVIEKKEGFKVRFPTITWFGKITKVGQMMEVDKTDNNFYLYLDPNIIYELYVNEIIELINFIDKIRDKTQKMEDWRLFKDKD